MKLNFNPNFTNPFFVKRNGKPLVPKKFALILIIGFSIHWTKQLFDLIAAIQEMGVEPGAFYKQRAVEYQIISMFFYAIMISIHIYNLFSRITAETSDIDVKILNFVRKTHSEEIINFCFKPLIADWKKEYDEYLKQGKRIRADFLTIRYAWAFLIAIIRQTQIGKLFDWLNK